MAVDEQENELKKNSEKNRIKNITSKVHPEYDRPKTKKLMTNSTDAKKKSDARRAAIKKKKMEERARKIDEIRKKRAQVEEIRKKEQRQRYQKMMRIGVGCLVFVALLTTFIIVRKYNSASGHDEKGMTAYENANYENAVKEFKEALSYDEKNADYYIHLGMAYIEQKAYDEALGYFNQAESYADSDNQTVLLNRGKGIASLYQGDYAGAITYFDAALNSLSKKNDWKMDILYYKAEAEEKMNDYSAAVGSYTQIIDMDDDAGARMLRGIAYVSLGDYSNAETDLYEAIKQSKKSYAIYRALYTALMAQGKNDEANEVLNEALELSGSSSEDYFNRGMIYIDLNDMTNAVETLQKSYDKGYKAALLGLGEAALKSNDAQTALSYYETFFNEANLDNTDAALLAKGYNQYAVSLLSVGNYEAAAAACENGLKYNNREADASLTFNLISSYEHLARWEDAYNLAKTYVEKYPDDAKGVKEYQFLESRMAQ